MRAAAPFVVAVATAMRRWGAPAWRLEDDAARLAAALNVPVGVHVLPTSMLVSDPHGVRVVTVRAGAPALDRTEAAGRLIAEVVDGRTTPDAALARLATIEAAPPTWSAGARWLAGGGSAAAAAVLLGGGPAEIAAAGTVGVLTAVVPLVLGGSPERARLAEPAAAVLAGLLVGLWPVPLAGELALLAGLIAFLPGFSLTTAMIELATGHLVSGATGLVAAGVALLQLGLGVAIGSRVAQALVGTAASAAAVPVPELVPAAMAVAALGFAVLLSVPPRHIPLVAAAIGAAWAGAAIGGELLGLGLGALLVAVLASAVTRRAGLPLALVQTPGLLLLVPGSIGFRAVQALIRGEVDAGVGGLTGMALSAMALVGGSLVGAALLPIRPPIAARWGRLQPGGVDAVVGRVDPARGVQRKVG